MNLITIVGVGLSAGELTANGAKALLAPGRVVLRTSRLAIAQWLEDNNRAFTSLDAMYEGAADFDMLTERMIEAILSAARDEPVVYAVPDVRDRAAQALVMRLDKKAVAVLPGVPIDAHLAVLAQEATLSIAAPDIAQLIPDGAQATLVREIDSREAASDVKLRLMERYPAEHIIHVQLASGAVAHMQLMELDRLSPFEYGHHLAAFAPSVSELQQLERYGFTQLNEIMRRLRAPDGCPWDRKQTHDSIATNVVEEAYEVVDAIRKGDMDALYDELGDLMLQVTLHAEIARQHGEFDIDDVTTAICQKLISRHEHIFGAAKADTEAEVLDIWEAAKKKERKIETVAETMRAVTNGLPQLMRAMKVQKKAANVGFDWDDALGALSKVYEEADEVKQALQAGSGLVEEMGDLLFAAVNVARLMKVDPELALNQSTDKFIRRFTDMERLIIESRGSMEGMTLPEMDEYWDKIKQFHVKE